MTTEAANIEDIVAIDIHTMRRALRHAWRDGYDDFQAQMAD